MDGRTIKVKLIVRRRWWLRWYLLGVWACSQATGLEPDPVKARRWINRGLYVQVVR